MLRKTAEMLPVAVVEPTALLIIAEICKGVAFRVQGSLQAPGLSAAQL